MRCCDVVPCHRRRRLGFLAASSAVRDVLPFSLRNQAGEPTRRDKAKEREREGASSSKMLVGSAPGLLCYQAICVLALSEWLGRNGKSWLLRILVRAGPGCLNELSSPCRRCRQVSAVRHGAAYAFFMLTEADPVKWMSLFLLAKTIQTKQINIAAAWILLSVRYGPGGFSLKTSISHFFRLIPVPNIWHVRVKTTGRRPS